MVRSSDVDLLIAHFETLDRIDHILKSFESISLSEMDDVQLMNRTDTKFMLSRSAFESILPALAEDYRVLEINGHRISRYQTLYYDTKNFALYLAHHNGKKNRSKIRKRKYIESDLSFLEIKLKSNSGRTIKSRIRLDKYSDEFSERELNFIHSKTPSTGIPEPKLENSFRRITLVNRSLPERVTIDLDVAFENPEKRTELTHLVIAEVKQENVNRHSTFMKMVKQRIIRPEGVSKYCLGVALLYPGIKSNTFKEKILKINKLDKKYA